MQLHRGLSTGDRAAEQLKVTSGTYYKLERGTHAPSATTARALARWLGWTVEQVLDAADQPAPPRDSPEQLG